VRADEWLRLGYAMAILTALYAFPVISIWLDERRKHRHAADRHEVSQSDEQQPTVSLGRTAGP
jgi:hypothetical protein